MIKIYEKHGQFPRYTYIFVCFSFFYFHITSIIYI